MSFVSVGDGHLVAATFFDGLLAMVTIYFDDSGTHAQSSVAIAAAYVGSVEQWKFFERDWKDANAAEHFGVFHMADFSAHAKPFDTKEWYDEAKRTRTLHRFSKRVILKRVRNSTWWVWLPEQGGSLAIAGSGHSCLACLYRYEGSGFGRIADSRCGKKDNGIPAQNRILRCQTVNQTAGQCDSD